MIRTLHLFAGMGGGLLADRILGHRIVGAVEWSPECCAILRKRAADGWFPGLEVHEGDIREFNPRGYAGRVECVSGGFPCQDISKVGKRRGIAGERSGLWSEYARVLDAIRPQFAFIENSPMLTLRGLDRVLCDLASLGYDAEWEVIPAAAIGAPHQRERIWILAYANGNRRELSLILKKSVVSGAWIPEVQAQSTNDYVSKAKRLVGMVHAERSIPLHGWQCAESISPEEAADVLGVDDGMANAIHRIKALGNGQVPLQAAVAWTLLYRRIASE